MKDFIINHQTVKSGECTQIVLNSYELHTKTKIEIPVFVSRSKKKGATILLSAGMHGEETNGIEIIRKIITREDIQNCMFCKKGLCKVHKVGDDLVCTVCPIGRKLKTV